MKMLIRYYLFIRQMRFHQRVQMDQEIVEYWESACIRNGVEVADRSDLADSVDLMLADPEFKEVYDKYH